MFFKRLEIKGYNLEIWKNIKLTINNLSASEWFYQILHFKEWTIRF